MKLLNTQDAHGSSFRKEAGNSFDTRGRLVRVALLALCFFVVFDSRANERAPGKAAIASAEG